MAQYYAWTEIKKAGDEEGTVVVVSRGEEVSQESLGVSDDEWAQLVDSAVVRKKPYPDMPDDFTGSPNEYMELLRNREMEELDEVFGQSPDDEEEIEVVGASSPDTLSGDPAPAENEGEGGNVVITT